MTERFPKIATRLIADGWREYPDQFRPEARAFFKHFPATVCASNDDRPGVQVGVYVYAGFKGAADFELSLTAHTHGGEDAPWVKIEPYAIADLDAALNFIPRLLSAWEAIAKPELINQARVELRD
jgi:hypothetical protein